MLLYSFERNNKNHYNKYRPYIFSECECLVHKTFISLQENLLVCSGSSFVHVISQVQLVFCQDYNRIAEERIPFLVVAPNYQYLFWQTSLGEPVEIVFLGAARYDGMCQMFLCTDTDDASALKFYLYTVVLLFLTIH